MLLQRLFAVYPKDRRYVLAVLEDVQAQLGCLPPGVLAPIADHFACPIEALRQWREHCEAFRPRPPARHRLQVCTGPVCRACGSRHLLAALRCYHFKDVDIEGSHCLGACGAPPVARLDDRRFYAAEEERLAAAINGLDDG